MKTFVKLLTDETGATAAEYALILAIVGTAIAAGAYLLGTSIANAVNGAAACIANSSGGC